MRRITPLHLFVVSLLLVSAVLSHRVLGTAQDAHTPHKVATADLLTLLEDMLQTDRFRPEREAFRTDWEERLTQSQETITQIENELRLATSTNPNIRGMQQRYQQEVMGFQRLQQEAAQAFDRFSAEQAADAYADLHAGAQRLAESMGYSHLIVSRHGGDIDERGNLATVTQEILARTVVLFPETDDITARVREELSIPVRPARDETAEGDGAGGDSMDDAGAGGAMDSDG